MLNNEPAPILSGKSRLFAWKKIFTMLVLTTGLITFTNAQGITNTLGGNTADDKFIVENSDSEAGLVVTGEGKVGVGTTSPLSQLSVGGDGNNDATIYGETSASTGRGVYGYASNGGAVYNYGGYFEAAGQNARAVYSYASNNSGANYGGFFVAYGNMGRGVYGKAGNSGNVTNYGGYFTASGSSGHGVYGIATSSESGTNYGGYFEAAGTSGRGVSGKALGSSGTGVLGQGTSYAFFAIAGGVAYGGTSSIRWKRNIIEIDNPLDKLAELRGVYFDWDEEHGGQHDVGCIAEEVGKVLPEIVVYEENGVDADGMDYSKLTPLLVEVAKAQQKLIEDLTKRVEELENR